MSEHELTTALDRYPTCTCGSGTWPCKDAPQWRTLTLTMEVHSTTPQYKALASALMDAVMQVRFTEVGTADEPILFDGLTIR